MPDKMSEVSCFLCGKIIPIDDLLIGPSARGLAIASDFSELLSKDSKKLSTAEIQFLAFTVDKHVKPRINCKECRERVQAIKEHYENQTEEEAIAEDEEVEWKRNEHGIYDTHIVSQVVHIMEGGRTKCQMEGMPCDWPDNHKWVPFNDEEQLENANCEICAIVKNDGKPPYRAVLDIVAKYDSELRSDDPRFRRCVKIGHDDGSSMFYRNAFVLKLHSWFMIFTEHHGSHVYHISDIVTSGIVQTNEITIDQA